MMCVMPPEEDPAQNWRFNKAVGGGVTYDIGCYCINQLRWAMGEEPETVSRRSAAGARPAWTSTWSAIATFPGGRTAEWCVSWQAGPRHVAEVLGQRGWAADRERLGRQPGLPTTLEIFDRQRNRTVESSSRPTSSGSSCSTCRTVLDNGVPHRIPPANSIAQMRVIDAVYASLKSGQVERVAR